ncbi:MAG: HDOD domain-containing protein [Candidatus Hydrogenedentes bacterium]|nr:HDOD domain-containing protein [Candidatus Hydrogenedentota bacterium]
MSCTRVGDLLVEADLISEFQLAQALEYQQSRGGKTVGILVEMGSLAPDDFYRFLARRGVPAFNPVNCKVSDHVANLLPRDLVLKHEMLPVDRLGRLLTVVMVYPFDIEGIQAAETLTGLRVKPVLCRAKEFREAAHTMYPLDYEILNSVQTVGRSSSPAPSKNSALTNAQQTLSRVRALESLPISRHTKGRFSMLGGVGGINAERAANILSRDPIALAHVLATANAREWTCRRQIVDRHDAIRILGLSAVIETVQSLTTFDTQLRFAEPTYTAWRETAVAVAETAGNIAKNYANVAAPGIYEAALLHSIGSLALLHLDFANYPDVFNIHPAGLRRQRELELYGITESDAGSELAAAWGLPEPVLNTIRFMNTPESAPKSHDTVAVTALAHHIVQMERNLEADCTEALRILGLTQSTLRSAVLRLHATSHADAVEI